MIPVTASRSRDLALPLNLSMTHELFQARHARFTMSNLLNFFLPLMATTLQYLQLRGDGVEQTRGARQFVGRKCGRASMPPH